MSAKLSANEVILEIEKFLNGTGDAYDWDDFLTFPIYDQQLDEIRIECAELRDKYPPGGCRQYCGDEGLKRLKEIVEQLRTTREEPR
jgi:hypothetical protein